MVRTGISIESALELRERWQAGQFSFEFSDHRWYVADPQFIDPTPAILTDIRFRRSLMYTMDREEMATTLQAGLSPVAHSLMAPNQPEYREIEDRVVKYEYDPRKAAQIVEELGYQKGLDGIYRDAAGQRLEVEIWASNATVEKPMLAVAGYWQRLGVATSTMVIPTQRSSDWPWRAAFPGFQMFTGTHDLEGLPALQSARARLPENNFEVAGIPNWPRYRSPEMDSLVDRFFTTIPKSERLRILGDINVHISEQLNLMGLYYFPTPYAISNRLVNIPTGRASRASVAWNASDWDART